MQTKNINQNPQGTVYQNCNGGLYRSTCSLQNVEDAHHLGINGNLNANKYLTPTQITQSLGHRNNYGSVIGPPSEATSQREMFTQQNQHTIQYSQTTGPSTTPQAGSGCMLKRQSSLGQLDERILDRSKQEKLNDGRLCLIQQKIKSFLVPSSKKSAESNPTVHLQQTNRVESTPNLNHCPCPSGSSHQRTVQSTTKPQEALSNVETPTNSFASMTNGEEDDSVYLRDVCHKWFGRRNIHGLTSSMVTSVNKPVQVDSPKLSHNLKTTLYDKVTPKENIYGCSSNSASRMTAEDRLQQLTCSNGEVNTTRLQQEIASESQSSSSLIEPQQVNEQHVVVVSELQNGQDNQRTGDSKLTVRSEQPTNETSQIQCLNVLADQVYSEDFTSSTNAKLIEFPTLQANIAGTQENYKSSSESGRGTMRSNHCDANKNDGTNANSSVDLTSLDSDQSTPCSPSKVWDHQDKSDSLLVSSNSVKIEKMQRELQRILEDGSLQSSEIEVEDLARDFHSRLSVVNESDSWISNTPPPPTTTAASSTMKTVPNKENKNCKTDKTNGSFPTTKQRSSIVEKQGSAKQIAANCKQRLANQRTTKNQPIYANKKMIENSSSQKYRLRNASLLMRSRNLDDCDIASTTTCRDGDSLMEYPDDISSVYTANTSCWDKDESHHSVKKQLVDLENMYSEILTLLNSRMKSTKRRSENCGLKTRRKLYGSASSVTGSVTKEPPYYRRNRMDQRKGYEDNSTNQRIKRLESHMMTLAKSVAQLSAEIRASHELAQEVECVRRECDWIQEQFRVLKINASNGMLLTSKAHHQSNTHISSSGRDLDWVRRDATGDLMNPGRIEKLTRFFGDEPPVLRQFLKKLGYEKYAKNFEQEKIGIAELPYLSEERLQRLGIPMGPRMKILQEAQSLVRHNLKGQFDIYAVI